MQVEEAIRPTQAREAEQTEASQSKTRENEDSITKTVNEAPHPELLLDSTEADQLKNYGKNLRSGVVHLAPPPVAESQVNTQDAAKEAPKSTKARIVDPRLVCGHETPHRAEYTSPLVTSASSSQYTLPHTGSNPAENTRRVKAAAMALEPAANSEGVVAEMMHSPLTKTASIAGTLSSVAPRAASMVEYLAQSLGFESSDTTGAQPLTSGVHKQRVLRVRLSMDDPTIDDVLRRAHQLFVSGETLQSLRAAGVTAQHLMRIGVTFEEWHRCGLTVRDLGFMGATWRDVARMGFCPSHMTRCREGSGPSVLAGHPFSATFDDLERDLGLSIDEAIYVHHMTTARLFSTR